MDTKELNLYEVNEFNKKMKEQLDNLNNPDRETILSYSNDKLKELNGELKELQIKEIENDGQLTAQEWLKKAFLEQEIEKHQDTISTKNAEKQEIEKNVLDMRIEKEDALRELDLKEAKVQKKIANLQEKWNKAAEALNNNIVKLRGLDPESEEYKELEKENKKHRSAMKRNVITSKTGMKLQKELEDIQAMKNLLKSGNILDGLKNPKEQEEPEKTKQSTKKVKSKEKETGKEKEIENTKEEEQLKESEQIKEGEQIVQPGQTQQPMEPKKPTQPKQQIQTKQIVQAEPIKKQVQPQQTVQSDSIKKQVQVVTPTQSKETEHEEKIKNEKEEIIENQYSKLTIEELKQKQRELFAKIIEDDDYQFRAHQENGMEEHGEDLLDKELKAVREEIERRVKQEKELTDPVQVEQAKEPEQKKKSFFIKVKEIFISIKGMFNKQKKLPEPEQSGIKTIRRKSEFSKAINSYINESNALRIAEQKSKTETKVIEEKEL